MVIFSSFSVPYENFTSFHPWFLDFVHVFRPFWTLQRVKLHFFAPKWGLNTYILSRAHMPKGPWKTLNGQKWSFSSFSVPYENFTSFHPRFLDFVHVFRPFWTLQGVKLSIFTLKWGSNPYIFNWAQRSKVPCKTLSDQKWSIFCVFQPQMKIFQFSPMVLRLCACF